MRKTTPSSKGAPKGASPVSEIVFAKPPLRWLWGGFGFHNSEAQMTGLMSDEFRNERALKSFLEISPSYSRVFAGFADWTKEAMDRFADWYDASFRKCGTTLYAVPGRMPTIMEDFDCESYAEATARNLEYVIKERGCSRIAHFAVTNECSVGPIYDWFGKPDLDGRDRWKIFRDLNRAMFRAFRRHSLDVGLMTTDQSGPQRLKDIEAAMGTLDDITDTYCWHFYDWESAAGDPGNYGRWSALFKDAVALVERKFQHRRISLGEFGLKGRATARAESGCEGVMGDDRSYTARHPAEAAISAMARAEMGLAAMNAGFVTAVSWTFCDYPDPSLGWPGGETPRELAEQELKKYGGMGRDLRYNKWGLFRWDDDNHDYSSYPDLYTMGWLAKLFRRGGRVLPWMTDDDTLRAGAITNADGSLSVALINWGEAKEIALKIPHPVAKPMRLYEYDSAHVPFNPFNDLQGVKCLVEAGKGADGESVVRVPLAAKSMVFLTTDYEDRTPAAVRDVRLDGGTLRWCTPDDPDHRYFRVFRDGEQIASTVADHLDVGEVGDFRVVSVDRWNNVGK
ncbi:MAG: hypothetical protein ILM98_01585 [Kiritimatiellae bacterium]|nr:hypothetical protein [Kiritimatiellia bacterium]